MDKNKKIKTGFTIVETLVVIVIIAILSAATALFCIGLIEKAKATQDKMKVSHYNIVLATLEEKDRPTTKQELIAILQQHDMVIDFKTASNGYFWYKISANIIGIWGYEEITNDVTETVSSARNVVDDYILLTDDETKLSLAVQAVESLSIDNYIDVEATIEDTLLEIYTTHITAYKRLANYLESQNFTFPNGDILKITVEDPAKLTIDLKGPIYHTVTFIDFSGNAITKTVLHNQTVEALVFPVKNNNEYYLFDGWSRPLNNIQEDCTIYALGTKIEIDFIILSKQGEIAYPYEVELDTEIEISIEITKHNQQLIDDYQIVINDAIIDGPYKVTSLIEIKLYVEGQLVEEYEVIIKQ